MAKTFEASLGELEKIVKQLEDGDLPLEQSLKLFEEGVKLSRECRERLATAERRIEMLMKDGEGNLTLAEIQPEGLRDEKSGNGVKKRIVFETDDEPPF